MEVWFLSSSGQGTVFKQAIHYPTCCTTGFGLVGENQGSFDFKGAWPNVVQPF